MWIPDLLIVKLLTVDRNAARAISFCRVTTLHHESLNYPVEFVTLVVLATATVLTSAKPSKVFTCLWHILKKFEHHTLLNVTFFSFGAD
jgi:hypothetical protein